MLTQAKSGPAVPFAGLTSRSIAYVAIQVSTISINFNLPIPYSNVLVMFCIVKCQFVFTDNAGQYKLHSSWQAVDIDFNNAKYYSVIINFFENTPVPVAQTKAGKLLK